MAATHKALACGVFFADPVTQRTSSLILDRLYHRGETIRLIHRDLSNSSRASSDALIAAVALMIGIEVSFLPLFLVGFTKFLDYWRASGLDIDTP
jgi:hypothetical protein